jgi:hypothetical protein|nr:MAG TPA: hypothetical protein [Caudoviricetes sp.]
METNNLLQQAQVFTNKFGDSDKKEFKPFEVTYKDGNSIATELLNREFNILPYDLLPENYCEEMEIQMPSYEFFESILESNINEDEKDEEIERLQEEWAREHIEVMTSLYRISRTGEDYYLNSEYCNIDVLAHFGIGVVEYKGYYFLNIAGCGYSFIDKHFIPLFTFLGWIQEKQ